MIQSVGVYKEKESNKAIKFAQEKEVSCPPMLMPPELSFHQIISA